MKRFTLILIASLFILNCSTEKTPVDEIAEMRCDCLRLHSIEKENFMEVIKCINEVNANDKFKDLGESIEYGNMIHIASALWEISLEKKGYFNRFLRYLLQAYM